MRRALPAVSPLRPVNACKRIETELPADFDDLLSVSVDRLDADAHHRETEAFEALEVLMIGE